tara:strand:+ start:658 stop:774 length:117 start_codon:yes stop_codon:yes gene_type:complete
MLVVVEEDNGVMGVDLPVVAVVEWVEMDHHLLEQEYTE